MQQRGYSMNLDLNNIISGSCDADITTGTDVASCLDQVQAALDEGAVDEKLYPKVTTENSKTTWDFSNVEQKPIYKQVLEAIGKDLVGYSQTALTRPVLKVVYDQAKAESYVIIQLA